MSNWDPRTEYGPEYRDQIEKMKKYAPIVGMGIPLLLLLLIGVFSSVYTVQPEEVARWTGRTLVFQRTPLGEAADDIEAMYGVQVRVAPALRDRTLTALFTDEPLDGLVPTLCRAVTASCTVSDTLVIVEAKE